jgi:hypothetical protein
MRALAAGALLPFLPWPTSARAAAAHPIAPPLGPMLFTRRLTRELPGDAAIVAERGFEVRFATLPDGFAIDGAQVSSSVEAPPSLAAYAEIERQRVETGLFPLELDARGLIRRTPSASSPATLERGVELALAQVKAMPLPAADKDEARAFLLGLEQAAGRINGAPPIDLFTPPPAPEEARRDVALPGGLSGSISSRFSGTVSPATGLLATAERIVVTQTAGSTRRTIEEWRLSDRIPA